MSRGILKSIAMVSILFVNGVGFRKWLLMFITIRSNDRILLIFSFSSFASLLFDLFF